eukprot:TRINITY_DN63122_c0_g1_i1.p1 TRINITY_DN63122_c0_g1~~TRINITY_DN63122_c0_g1_i1.p1  ORF type:complete len:505 (-),score=58.27 TRINITY_DN63122_c0_g1_i1:150-1664(-)
MAHVSLSRAVILTMRFRCGFAIVLFMILTVSRLETTIAARQQVVVIDAGTSGTRVHVFDVYPPRKGAVVPSVELQTSGLQVHRLKPGMSQLASQGDIVGIRRHMKRVVDYGSALVSKPVRSSTPIVFKGTSGLRDLPKKKAKVVLGEVKATLASSGFLFQGAWARIISGTEEAGLAWIAANYLNRTFVNGSAGHHAGPTVGIIEMASGSTQVAFQVESFDPIRPTNRFSFATNDGKQYRLYAHSYSGYGQDYAQSKLIQMLSESTETDPCYPAGYSREGVHGTGDAEACILLIKRLLLSAEKHADAPGAYAAERALHGHFIATEKFFWVRKNVPLFFKADQAEMLSAAVGSCKQTRNVEIHDAQASEDPLEPRSCFALSYQLALLQSLNAFNSDVKIAIAHEIHGGYVEWALGAALAQMMAGATDGKMPLATDDVEEEDITLEHDPIGLLVDLADGDSQPQSLPHRWFSVQGAIIFSAFVLVVVSLCPVNLRRVWKRVSGDRSV